MRNIYNVFGRIVTFSLIIKFGSQFVSYVYRVHSVILFSFIRI